MPASSPPAICPGHPVLERVPIGATVFRVHSDRYPANAPHPSRPPASGIGGARFDSPDGSYASLYVADDPAGAIAETLCRDLPFDGRRRLIPHARLVGRSLSTLVVVEELVFVAAHGPHLAQLGQDGWLTSSYPHEYGLTRAWGAAIRGWCAGTDGLAYRCRHDNDRLAYVAWTPLSVTLHHKLQVVSTMAATDPVALLEIRRVARAHNAAVSRP